MSTFQQKVGHWVMSCFGVIEYGNKKGRVHRFIEESIELSQAFDVPKEDVLKLVDYVYGRPPGDPGKEVGGVMVTLAALCNAAGINMGKESLKEVDRIEAMKDEIREKFRRRPDNSPLPGSTP